MLYQRSLALCLGLALLTACQKDDLDEPPVPLGDFVLGHNIVFADKMQKVPISREATVDEWEAAMKKAIDDRFGRYDGDHIYDFGISVDAYALAPAGIPIIAAPKSVLVITANIWDDETQQKLNVEGERLMIFESLSGETVISSGLTRSKEKQMEVLSYNAAKKVEEWLLQHPEWFAKRDAATAAPAAGEAAAAVNAIEPAADD